MYLQNKYTRVYFNIIGRAKLRTLDSYTELHHIIPKSLGGSNSLDNIVNLTSREHFICHRLLTKMTVGEEKRKMCFAMKIMTADRHNLRYIPSGRTFEFVREQARNAQIGVLFSDERKSKIKEARARQIFTDETRKKMSLAGKGRVISEKQKEAIRKANSKPRSPETIAKIKEARSNQVIVTKLVTCPHCGKEGGNRIMPRYHFDNCKFR